MWQKAATLIIKEKKQNQALALFKQCAQQLIILSK
jgi:hypothetical protein